MAKSSPLRIGPRDLELLQALDVLVVTPSQLLKLSTTFREPFSEETTVRRRLRKLRAAGLVQPFPFAVAGRGQAPQYWKLTQNGFRLLNGDDVALPKRRYFEAISPGRHGHTLALADVVVHLLSLAARDGFRIQNLSREGSVCIETNSFRLFPDFGLELVSPAGKQFNFLIELDNGTERVRSKQAVESLERKIRGYDSHQSQFKAYSPERYVVLFVTTRSPVRVEHIRDVIRDVTRNHQRRAFLTAGIDSVLQASSLAEAVFHDLNGPVALVTAV